MSASKNSLPPIVSREEWLAERKTLLLKEKEMTKKMDQLSAERRRLPMVEVTKNYLFEGPSGEVAVRKVNLLDLFEGRKQLIIYHFMFDPNNAPEGKSGAPWDEGCDGCSFVADNTPNLAHLHARDTSFVVVSRAPLSKINPFKKRMGWTFPWYSSYGSNFNYDFHVTIDESVAPVEYNFKSKKELEAKGEAYHIEGEQPGVSVFLRDGDRVFHTYSAYSRGLEQAFLVTFHLLDLTPYGRQEVWEDSPQGWPQTPAYQWWRHHDKYSEEEISKCGCH